MTTDPTKCKAFVWDAKKGQPVQCPCKPEKDGYCKNHGEKEEKG
jgi:hypothetical protein